MLLFLQFKCVVMLDVLRIGIAMSATPNIEIIIKITLSEASMSYGIKFSRLAHRKCLLLTLEIQIDSFFGAARTEQDILAALRKLTRKI